ncbi:serine hydrolase FSH [Jackrogersella minutella]|nr:serine hydrolase FSH [Jackrogersella minutella]
MRFLCLHGMGTNSAVFEAQLAPIIANLDPSHEFVYIDGLIECEASEGVGGVFPGPFYCYYSQPTLSQLQAAFDLIHDIIDEEGPFDGIIGFSQGAALAASFLLHQQETDPNAPEVFRMAIFTCASLPFDPTSDTDTQSYDICPKTGTVRLQPRFSNGFVESFKVSGYIDRPSPEIKLLHRYNADITKTRIHIPTLHIMGEEDPYLPQSKALVGLCAGEKNIVSHHLGHRLPRDILFSRKAAMTVENTISRALFQS